MRRFVRTVALLAVVLSSLAMISSAFAASGNGQGQTPLSASLGFNAKDDLSGQLNYNGDPNGPNAGFSVHCDGYTSFRFNYNHGGYPHIVVSATCTDQDGATIYMKFGMTDRGEPGTKDTICMLWGYSLPLTHENAYIHDHGFITAGNIQIHTDPLTGQWVGEMIGVGS
jgi:hypothetical protein